MRMRSIISKKMKSLLLPALMLCCGAVFADQATTATANIRQLTQSGESVVIGKCIGKATAMVGHNIETTYDFEVSESLKGPRKAGSKLKLVVLGGKHPLYAIAQHVPQQAHLYKGEEAALFLKEPQPGAAKAVSKARAGSGLPDSVKVVGGWQGKYSVFTDAADGGKRKLVRFNLENYGYAHSDSALESFIKAYAGGKMSKATDKTVNTMVKDVAVKQNSEKGERTIVLSQPSVSEILPPVVSLDDFKAEVNAAK